MEIHPKRTRRALTWWGGLSALVILEATPVRTSVSDGFRRTRQVLAERPDELQRNCNKIVTLQKPDTRYPFQDSSEGRSMEAFCVTERAEAR